MNIYFVLWFIMQHHLAYFVAQIISSLVIKSSCSWGLFTVTYPHIIVGYFSFSFSLFFKAIPYFLAWPSASGSSCTFSDTGKF
jgi:hypothetical protein